ncbi:hypothetical protein TrVE_jg2186 [Triparma verrucosa]|uniref:Uncharacterized protein n=1 Tax=Triparma verrucosa TaxID=1606542 RepID=A0A9W7FLS5_9STRA|nr:hypothetical protein TrVE_jg2186 [Triparma verrucosa]
MSFVRFLLLALFIPTYNSLSSRSSTPRRLNFFSLTSPSPLLSTPSTETYFHELSSTTFSSSIGSPTDAISSLYPCTYRTFNISSHILTVRQTTHSLGKLGSSIWSSSLSLSSYLPLEPSLIKNKKVIELGCGLGLPSIIASKLGADMVLVTDFWGEEGDRGMPGGMFRECIEGNFRGNGGKGEVFMLDWHDESVTLPFQPTVVIGSDLIYYPSDIIPLIETIKRIDAAEVLLFLPLSKRREGLEEFRRKVKEENTWLVDEEELVFNTHRIGRERMLKLMITQKK